MKHFRNIILVIILIILLLILRGDTKEEKYEIKDVVVCKNDTVWKIACENNPANKDVRELIYFIELDNNITPENLYVGQVIKVRIYETR